MAEGDRSSVLLCCKRMFTFVQENTSMVKPMLDLEDSSNNI